MALPNFELMLLGGADCAADHLKDVGRSAAMSIFDANRNGDDVLQRLDRARRASELARQVLHRLGSDVPILTGSNKPGKAQLARMASQRFPWVKTTGSPFAKSVATTAMGIRRSSKRLDSKTCSIRLPRRWLLAKPKRETRQRPISRKRIFRQVVMIRR